MREIVMEQLSNRDSVDHLRISVADAKLFQALKESMPIVNKKSTMDELEEKLNHKH